MNEIKKVSVWSAVKVLALIGLVLGIIFGIVASLYLSNAANQLSASLNNLSQAQKDQIMQTYGVSAEDLMANSEKTAEVMKALSSQVLYLGPLTFLVSHAILGLLFALLYNLFAKLVGGIKIAFKEK